MGFASEVLTYWIGQCGIQMGDASWELLCLEHEIGPNGKFYGEYNPDDMSFNHFFHEGKDCQYVPRTIFLDSEPTVVDEIRSGVYRDLFHPNYMLNYFEDASNNFARGFYGISKYIINDVVSVTRKVAEACEIIQGLFVIHSYGGGTGSGFSSMLMEFLSVEFSKTSKIELGLFPSPTLCASVVEPYNAVFACHTPMENADLSMIVDNEAIFGICQSKLNIDGLVFTHINRLVAQVFSGITAAFRFEGPSNTKIIDLQTNLVPYPRIHFPSISFSPLENPFKAIHDTLTTKEITMSALSKENQLLMMDPSDGFNIACALLYRGDVSTREIQKTLSSLRLSGKLTFVDWCPTGIKTGINYQPMTLVPPSGMAYSSKSVSVLMNSTALKSAFTKINKKFLMLFDKRAFIHWYLSEGMEEGEFKEAYDDLINLESDLNTIEDLDSDGSLQRTSQRLSQPSSQQRETIEELDNKDFLKSPKYTSSAAESSDRDALPIKNVPSQSTITSESQST